MMALPDVGLSIPEYGVFLLTRKGYASESAHPRSRGAMACERHVGAMVYSLAFSGGTGAALFAGPIQTVWMLTSSRMPKGESSRP
jgi:hypothetical protein